MADDRDICGTCKWCWKEYGYWSCKNKYSSKYDTDVSYEESCDKYSSRDKSYADGIIISGKRNVPKV